MTPTRPALLIALSLLLAAPAGARQPKVPRRGRALPEAPAAAGVTGGLAVLRAPPPAEVLIAGGEFIMGSMGSDIGQALDLCRREDTAALCELPMERESRLHANLGGVHPDEVLHNETSPHRVTLSAYWLDQREVTVEEYARCAEVGPCRRVPYEAGAVRFSRPDFPVTYVTFDDASVYCKWRGKRLPTEAEWERAARGAGGRVFPWGNEFLRRASNHGQLGSVYYVFQPTMGVVPTFPGRERRSIFEHDPRDGYLELAPVGSFPDGRTPDGIDDLAGNVAEWVSDLYEPHYGEAAEQNPQGPGSSKSPFRVVRGGSYLHSVLWLRGAARLMAFPDERGPWLGFRCARGR